MMFDKKIITYCLEFVNLNRFKFKLKTYLQTTVKL